MKKFITNSVTSKKILKIAHISLNMPVNIMIIGEVGVGKTLLAQQILSNTTIFDARFLENSIVQKNINLKQYNELIVTNIELVLNKKEFLQKLDGIKLLEKSTKGFLKLYNRFCSDSLRLSDAKIIKFNSYYP